jgi:hypothetical protein
MKSIIGRAETVNGKKPWGVKFPPLANPNERNQKWKSLAVTPPKMPKMMVCWSMLLKQQEETGFKWTTRISAGVHALCTPPKSNKIQSYRGRLHDVLWMAFMAIKRTNDDRGPIAYKLKIGRKIETLWITIDGTMGEPAIHIILPSDDLTNKF